MSSFLRKYTECLFSIYTNFEYVFKQQQAIPLQRNKDVKVRMTRSSLKLQVLFLLKVNYKLTDLKKVSAYHEVNNAGSGRGRSRGRGRGHCSGSGKNLSN